MKKQLSNVLAYPGFQTSLLSRMLLVHASEAMHGVNGRQWWMWEVDVRVGVFDMFITLW